MSDDANLPPADDNAPKSPEQPVPASVTPTVEESSLPVGTPIADTLKPAETEAARIVAERAANQEIEAEMHRMSRRSFLWGGVALTAGFLGWRWLTTRPQEDGIAWPFRRALEINEEFARDYFQGRRLAPTFDRARAREPRANGDIGLDEDFDATAWKLSVYGLANPPQADATASNSTDSNSDSGDNADSSDSTDDTSAPLILTLAQVKAVGPEVEMVTEFKCIEGWSEIVHWTGVRLADFIAKYPPATRSGDPPNVQHKPEDLVGYVSLETPDKGYYVGLEMASALHPQTLLCYAMNGQPLTPEHGAPLRLVIPVKYGIKNIKRIGAIRFTDRRPADYWAERGYDWYAGH